MSKLQLKAFHFEDFYIFDRDKCKFLDQSYEKHEIFFTQHVSLLNNGNSLNFSNGLKHVYTLSNEGDFLKNLTLRVKVPKLVHTSGTYAGWTNAFMYAFIQKICLKVGNTVLDEIHGTQLDMLNEFTYGEENDMVGKDDYIFQQFSAIDDRVFELKIPLWFTKKLNNAFPIGFINQIKELHIYTNSFDQCITYDGVTPPNPVNVIESSLIGEYITVKKNYRDLVCSRIYSGIDYLIEQHINYKTFDINSNNCLIELNFKNPIKELIFAIREKNSVNNNDHFNYSRTNDNNPPLVSMRIKNEGVDANKSELPESYLRFTEPLIYHTNVPKKYVYVYSFALKPEDFDPSGTLNMSAIIDFVLELKLNINSASELIIFGKSYNIISLKENSLQLKYV